MNFSRKDIATILFALSVLVSAIILVNTVFSQTIPM